MQRQKLPQIPWLCVLWSILVLFGSAAVQANDPLVSASSGGLTVVDDALARLAENRRLLMIAAHPDDEDTFLLTLVERAQHGEAAYFSLSRGEGGQNLIGSELGAGLGLLRSRELEAARRVDGAEQYFGRTYDFGYTRSIEETFEKWPQEVQLEDAMRVVRRHRPQVLVAVFPPTEAAGHGQHQASGWLAEEIFELSRQADDPFPELGLEPWRIESFFRAAWFRPQQATLQLPLGVLDPLTGRSIFQTALLSRSQHRCQDMGFEQPPGDAEDAVTWLAGRGGDDDQVAGSPDIFAGVDTRLRSIAQSLEEGSLRRKVAAELGEIESLAEGARNQLVPMRLAQTAPALAEIVVRLSGLLNELGESTKSHAHARALIEEKLAIARNGLAASAGVIADAVTDREQVRPGESFEVRTLLWRPGGVVDHVNVTLESPDGGIVGEASPVASERGFFTAQVTDERVATVTVSAEMAPGVPYFLARPKEGDLYDWTGVENAVKTRPFGPPPLLARFGFEVEGAFVELEREVVHRRRDQALGEVRRPLRVVPDLEVSMDRSLIVWPKDRTEPMTFQARLQSHLEEPATVRLDLGMPRGWPGVEPVMVELDAHGRADVAVEIRPPETLEVGALEIHASARIVNLETGRVGDRLYDRAYQIVDYEHVRPSVLPVAARTSLSVVDLSLPPLRRVAYVRGASDRSPELLAAVGVPIELMSAERLMVESLAEFDAIILGPRAYEVDATLADANSRVLDYARSGGLVLVQYQQYAYSRGGFAPLSLEIRRPHDRITDETSPVTAALPDHAVLRTPNEIGERDWQGWVQERGLYFAGTWDPAWQAPLALADPGREEQRGGLLIAELGEGHYVYTGLSFFRQLPAGVPGAYRLFGNLLAIGLPIAQSAR